VEAAQIGKAVNADIVLWGWVPEFTEAALVHNFTFIGDEYVVHNDLILESVNLMISGSNRIQMTQLSGRTKALSRFILALIYVRSDNATDYQQGLNLFIEGIQELENDRVRLTELIDKATSLDERLGLEETLAALQESLAVFHTGKGVALAALSQPDEALASYQTALALDDSYPRVHAVLGNYYYSLRQFDQAEAAYRKALTLEPETAGAWYGLGVIYYYGEEYEQALDHLEKAIIILEAADEDASQAYFAKGYVYLRLVQMAEARQSFATVLQSPEASDEMKETVAQQIEMIDNPAPVAIATAVPQSTTPPIATAEFIPTPTVFTAVTNPTAPATVASILGGTATLLPTLLPTIQANPTMTPMLFPTFAATATRLATLFPTSLATPPLATMTPTLFPTSLATMTSTLFPTIPATQPPPTLLPTIPATPTPSG
jgi:tetratricopeptide (TPR) repeat protein